MEKTCYRCNASIAEDAPFCPACGAPQIRVASQSGPAPSLDEIPETSSPSGMPIPTGAAPGAGEIQWKDFWRTAWPIAVLAGLAASWIPLLGFLVFLPLSVAIGIWFYHKRRGGTMRAGQGAKLGMGMGFISFITSATLAVAGIASSPAIRQEMIQRITEAASRNPDPGAQQFISLLHSPQGFAILMTIGFIFMMFMILAFTALTGAVAASTFGHKKQ